MKENVSYFYYSFVVVFLLFATTMTFYGQNNSNLSAEGARHWKAATALLEVSSTPEELSYVISEFENVANSDPSYADTYYNLGKLYTKLGKENGDAFFNKAKENFRKYLSLRPEERQQIEDELYIVDSIRKSTESYRKEKNKKSFLGTWKDAEYPNVAYIVRITEAGDSFDVQVSTSEERLLNTYDISFDGTYLSFTVRDSDDYYWHHQIHEISNSNWTVRCDEEVEYDHWQVKIEDNKMYVTNNVESYYYLNGKTVKSRRDKYTWIYAK